MANTKLTTKAEWREAFAQMTQILDLPCKLVFSKRFKIGAHVWHDGDDSAWKNLPCSLHIAPNQSWTEPRHLILHELAHHRATGKWKDPSDIPFCCTGGGFNGGHCKHWAKILIGFYKKTGVPLPQGTQFTEFALAAGLICRKFGLASKEPNARNS